MEATPKQIDKCIKLANKYNELEAIEEIENLIETPDFAEPISYTTSTGVVIQVLPDGSSHS